jgi:hypothetical protein
MIPINIPAIVLGFVLSTLYGAGFHLLRGGGAGRLILYLILGWLGFWIGNGLAGLLGWDFGKVGSLNVFIASTTSIFFLIGGYWLSLIEVSRK